MTPRTIGTRTALIRVAQLEPRGSGGFRNDLVVAHHRFDVICQVSRHAELGASDTAEFVGQTQQPAWPSSLSVAAILS